MTTTATPAPEMKQRHAEKLHFLAQDRRHQQQLQQRLQRRQRAASETEAEIEHILRGQQSLSPLFTHRTCDVEQQRRQRLQRAGAAVSEITG